METIVGVVEAETEVKQYSLLMLESITVEPVLKDHSNLAIKMWPLKTGGLGDRYNCIEIWDILPGISGLSRQVVSHGSGLSRHVLLYQVVINLFCLHLQWNNIIISCMYN